MDLEKDTCCSPLPLPWPQSLLLGRGLSGSLAGRERRQEGSERLHVASPPWGPLQLWAAAWASWHASTLRSHNTSEATSNGWGGEKLWAWSDSTCSAAIPTQLALNCKTSGHWVAPVMPTHSFALLRDAPVVHGSSYPDGQVLYHLTLLPSLLRAQLNRPWVLLSLSQGQSIPKFGLQFTNGKDDPTNGFLHDGELGNGL